MSNDDRSLTVLIQEMLDGVLDDKQRAELLKRVESDDAARKLYLDQIATHTALRAVLADCIPRRDVDHHQAMSQQAIHPGWFSRFPGGSLVHAALAATILLLVFGFANWWSRLPVESMAESTTESASAPYIAVISQAVGAYDDGIAIRAGQQVVSGQLNLDRGLVRLEFYSGATVVVEGPATVDLVDEMRVVLLRGVVTARIPESAIDFVVDTDTARVVDLGTAFGVAVADDGTTDVVVFEGEVSVRKKGLISNPSTLVREGEAVRASEESPTIDVADYEVKPFENAWPVNSGVLQTTGAVRFVSPGPEFHPGNYADNEHLVVFPERSGVTLQDVVRVDLGDPGEYVRSRYREKHTLMAGRRVTSYLLQFDSLPSEKFPNKKREVRGQITFSNAIVGVITETRLLQESEALFGNPDVDYPTPRAVEPRPEGDDRPGFDRVILAADQRTLILDLKVAPQKLDQLRVLVEAE
jgi:hypothetical protein